MESLPLLPSEVLLRILQELDHSSITTLLASQKFRQRFGNCFRRFTDSGTFTKWNYKEILVCAAMFDTVKLQSDKIYLLELSNEKVIGPSVSPRLAKVKSIVMLQNLNVDPVPFMRWLDKYCPSLQIVNQPYLHAAIFSRSVDLDQLNDYKLIHLELRNVNKITGNLSAHHPLETLKIDESHKDVLTRIPKRCLEGLRVLHLGVTRSTTENYSDTVNDEQIQEERNASIYRHRQEHEYELENMNFKRLNRLRLDGFHQLVNITCKYLGTLILYSTSQAGKQMLKNITMEHANVVLVVASNRALPSFINVKGIQSMDISQWPDPPTGEDYEQMTFENTMVEKLMISAEAQRALECDGIRKNFKGRIKKLG